MTGGRLKMLPAWDIPAAGTAAEPVQFVHFVLDPLVYRLFQAKIALT
jgi:hypothetical protein